MRGRRLTAVLLAVMGSSASAGCGAMSAAPAPPPGVSSPAGCPSTPEFLFPVGFGESGTETETAILARYAPRFLQFVSSPDDGAGTHGSAAIDLFTALDFDGNWKADDNWERADDLDGRQPAVVYGAVTAMTANQLYLLYYYFHARDFSHRSWLTGLLQHENDLEGGLFVIDRGAGRVIHAYALHHGNFDERHVGAHAITPPLHVWVEAGGHGGHLFDAATRVPQKRSHVVWYRVDPTGTPVHDPATVVRFDDWVPASHSTTQPLGIRRLWDVFRCMADPPTDVFADARDGHRMVLDGLASGLRGVAGTGTFYAALKGRRGFPDNAAHFPWGEGDDFSRFFDPVHMVLRREDFPHSPDAQHDRISCDYVFNPYLGVLLQGHGAVTDGAMPAFALPDGVTRRPTFQRQCHQSVSSRD